MLECYNALLTTNVYIDNKNLLPPLLDYFENIWLGKLDRRKKNPPKCLIKL